MFFDVLLVLVVGFIGVCMFVYFLKDEWRRAQRPTHTWTRNDQRFIPNRVGFRSLLTVGSCFLLSKGGHWLIQMMFR